MIRAVIALALALLGATGPLATAVVRGEPHRPNELCPGRVVILPRYVYLHPEANPDAWRAAMVEWNARLPGTFIEVRDSAAANAVTTPMYGVGTWVEWPCEASVATIYSDAGSDLPRWAAHELAHAGLGWADHLGDDLWAQRERWGNPGRCPEGYSGIVSYCTPRDAWWSADDRAAVERLTHRQDLTHHRVVTEVARGADR